MNRDELRATIVELIEEAVPGVQAGALAGSEDMREALDIDSFDVLQVAIAIKTRLGVEIAEADMPRIVTLDGCVEHVASLLPQG